MTKNTIASLIKKLANNKSQSTQSVKDSIDQYRSDSSSQILTKSCPKVMSVSQICNEATGLQNGTKIPSIDFGKIASYISTDESADKLQSMRAFYSNSSFSDQDLHAIMEAARCRIYGVPTYLPPVDDTNILNSFSIKNISKINYGNYDPTNLFNINQPIKYIRDPILGGGFYNFDKPLFVTTPTIDLSSVNANSINKALSNNKDNILTNGLSTNSASTTTSTSTTSTFSNPTSRTNSSGNEEVKYVDSGLAGSFTEAMKKTGSSFMGTSTPTMNPPFNGMGTHTFMDDSVTANAGKKEVTAPTTGTEATGNTALNDQLAELTRKLSATEDNLEKYKADKAATDSEKERQAKIDDQNNTIKDLRAQVDNLKSNPAVKPLDSTTVVSPTTSVADTTGFSLGKSTNTPTDANKPAQNTFAQNNQPSGFSPDAGGSSRAVSSSSSEGFSGASASGFRGPASFGGNASVGAVNSGVRTGIVLTKVDGLSSEKATETISDRITELNGQPFYIEEGGMVKEIIPIVKDGKVLVDDKGKPLFEKIVKGKVGDKKFAAVDANPNGGTRAPSSITTPADLSRDQEDQMKRERARYLKLKQITDGISGSN